MDRRLLMVMGTSLLVALALSAIFYQVVAGARKGGPPQASAKTRDLVVAARGLPFGTSLKSADVKLTKVLADQFPKDGFARVEEVLERPVIASILPEEAVREGRLAPRGSGLGLASIIPPGLRAVSVRVNDVVGVAGYVLPGVRVDVLVTGNSGGHETTITRTILQDILVLSAGQNIEPDGLGKAINAPVVTLLVTPEQAEVLTLASEGRIQLVLRNTTDRSAEKTPGRALADLYGSSGTLKPERVGQPPRARAAPPPPAAPPLPPATEEITVIRGNLKTVEQVAIKKSE
jgi:pilus assembly protein CpaB